MKKTKIEIEVRNSRIEDIDGILEVAKTLTLSNHIFENIANQDLKFIKKHSPIFLLLMVSILASKAM